MAEKKNLQEQKKKKKKKNQSTSELISQYRFLSENLLDVVWTIDVESMKFTYVSPSVEQIYGYTQREYIESAFSSIIPKNTAQEIQKIIADKVIIYNKTGDTQEYKGVFELKHKNGSKIYAEILTYFRKNPFTNKLEVIGTSRDVTQRKLAGEKLEFQAKLLNSVGQAVIATKPDGSIIYMNKFAEKLYQWSKEEAMGMNVLQVTVPQISHDKGFEIMKQLGAGKSWSGEFTAQKKDGTTFSAEVYDTPVLNKDGQLEAIIGISHDVSDQKKILDKLKESESKYRQLIETASDAIYMIDEKGKIFDTNKFSGIMLDRTKEEIIGLDIDEIDPNFPTAAFLKFWENIPPYEQKIFETTHVKKDGKPIPVEVSGLKYKLCDKFYYYGIARDLRERKKAEKTLKRNQEELAAIYKNAPMLMILLDEDTKVTKVNAFAENFHGNQVDKMKGMRSGEIFRCIHHINDPKGCGYGNFCTSCIIRNTILDTFKTGKMYEMVEAPLKVLSQGELKELFFLISTVLIHLDRKPYLLLSVLDVTHSKKIEKELIEAKERAEESDRLKSSFLANMSHEIRTPMNGILGFASLLKRTSISLEKRSKFIEIIESSGERMLNIINNLIDISKIEAGQMGVARSIVDINEILDYMHTFFSPEAKKKKLAFELFKSPDNKKLELLTDKEKLIAILTNLIKNAIKYTHAGAIQFGYKQRQQDVKFYVKDTGIGISEDKLKSIFKRFVQADVSISTPYEGAGLGLSISKAYVEMLQGKIWVESEIGKGSVFYFTLPVHPETMNEQDSIITLKNTENEGDAALSNLTILVVEDDQVAVTYFYELLEDQCKVMLNASTGVQAVETCRKRDDIDVILMDIKLPEMDGYMATKKIRGFNQDVIIIAQTAFALEGQKEKALKSGCNDYITKPIDGNILYSIINKHLKKRNV